MLSARRLNILISDVNYDHRPLLRTGHWFGHIRIFRPPFPTGCIILIIYAWFTAFTHSRLPLHSLFPSVVFLRFRSTLASYWLLVTILAPAPIRYAQEHGVAPVWGLAAFPQIHMRLLSTSYFSCVHSQSLAPPLLVQALESNSNS